MPLRDFVEKIIGAKLPQDPPLFKASLSFDADWPAVTNDQNLQDMLDELIEAINDRDRRRSGLNAQSDKEIDKHIVFQGSPSTGKSTAFDWLAVKLSNLGHTPIVITMNSSTLLDDKHEPVPLLVTRILYR